MSSFMSEKQFRQSVIFRPKAALNYPSTKNRDKCLFVRHRFLPVLSFWPYSILTISSEPNEKPMKILSVLKIFFTSSGKEPYRLKGD